MSDPEVVCLCGSTRFKQQYVEEYKRHAVEGKVVLSVGCFGHADDVPLTRAEKESLDRTHKDKIDMADRIHVLNVDGYIGESTADEIQHAQQTDTDVTFYSQQPEHIPADLLDGDESR